MRLTELIDLRQNRHSEHRKAEQSDFWKGYEEGWYSAYRDLKEILAAGNISTEELRPKGEWIGEADGYADGELVYDVWNCSECNYCIDDGTDDPELLPNYCPNCGAKMRGAKYE